MDQLGFPPKQLSDCPVDPVSAMSAELSQIKRVELAAVLGTPPDDPVVLDAARILGLCGPLGEGQADCDPDPWRQEPNPPSIVEQWVRGTDWLANVATTYSVRDRPGADLVIPHSVGWVWVLPTAGGAPVATDVVQILVGTEPIITRPLVAGGTQIIWPIGPQLTSVRITSALAGPTGNIHLTGLPTQNSSGNFMDLSQLLSKLQALTAQLAEAVPIS